MTNIVKQVDKVAILQNLKKEIENDNVIPYDYVGVKDGKKCYCAVGYIMSELGCSDVELAKFGKNSITLIRNNYDVEKLFNTFSRHDMHLLQGRNDHYGDKYYDNKGELKRLAKVQLLGTIDAIIQRSSVVERTLIEGLSEYINELKSNSSIDA